MKVKKRTTARASVRCIINWFRSKAIILGFCCILRFALYVAQQKYLPKSEYSVAAYEQSFGLFNNISEPLWNQMRDSEKTTSLYGNPQNPLDKVEDEAGWLANNLNPTFHCPHVERVGGGEGVKYLCYPQRLIREEKKDCLIYSIGCAGDFNFEDAMSKKYNKECEIHVFDPADWTRKDDVENRNIHYHPWGLASTYDKNSKSIVWPKGRGGGFKTFQESVEILGHKNRMIDILKIDCEGCEWSTHKDWIGFGFRQILLETHGVPQPNGSKGRWYQAPMNITDYFQDFRDNGYALFNKDPNGLAVELAFLKLDEDFYK